MSPDVFAVVVLALYFAAEDRENQKRNWPTNYETPYVDTPLKKRKRAPHRPAVRPRNL